MSLFILTYDVRSRNHDYARLYEQLGKWRTAHLQNSVWLAELVQSAALIRDTMMSHMHKDDTACVVQLPTSAASWATQNARPEGVQWLKAHFP
jgi:CRISPR/Cas system-associated endoribonuclease Cas2